MPGERMIGVPHSWRMGTGAGSDALRPRAGTTLLSHVMRRYSAVRLKWKDLFISVPVRWRLTSQPAVACAKEVTLAMAERTQSFISVCSSTLA